MTILESQTASAETTRLDGHVEPGTPVFERLLDVEALTRQTSEEANSLHVGQSSAEGSRDAAVGGDPERFEFYQMHSQILPDDRRITVYLPPQYKTDPGRRFPVMYLNDGQNLFDPQAAFIPGHPWRAGLTADRLNREGLAEPLILVGIANTGLRRMPEYTPSRDPRMGGGDGAQYARLLIEELKPFIDQTYRTLSSSWDTGIGGSSLGGLISLYLGFTHPEVFGRLAVISPSIWWDQRSILKLVEQTQPKPELHIWLDIGTAEGARHVRDTERLNRMLIQRGWKPGVDLECREFAGAGHDEDAWATRFDQVLAFLYPIRPR